MSDEDLETLEQVACPSAGACGAQFTANTMATVSSRRSASRQPHSAGAPSCPTNSATASAPRRRASKGPGARQGEPASPHDQLTRKALENSAAVVAASGGSTNAARSPAPPSRMECGIAFDLFDVAEIFKPTLTSPVRRNLGGRYVAQRFGRSWWHSVADEDPAGSPWFMPWRLLDRDYLASTMAEELLKRGVVWNLSRDVVRAAGPAGQRRRISAAVVWIAAAPALRCRSRKSPALENPEGFAGPGAAVSTARRPASRPSEHRKYERRRHGRDRRYEGTEAAVPACGRCSPPRRRSTARGRAARSRFIADGRFSGATCGFCVRPCAGPEAASGGT